jgi:hypothetical protein
MTKRPPVMGISIYSGDRLLGKALDVTIEGGSLSITIGPGTIDRFEVLRFLLSRSTADLMGEKSISNMPPLTLYCDPSTVKGDVRSPDQRKGKKKKGGLGEGIVKLTFQPQTIEIDPSMPGQNFSFKSFKGMPIGNMEVGVSMPEMVASRPVTEESPTLYY